MSSKLSSHPVRSYQKAVGGLASATAWLLLLTVTLVSCRRDVEKTTALRPRVPDVELKVTAFKVKGDLVVWLNGEPVGILRGPLSWVKASDTPLKEGVNEVRIAGSPVQDMSSDDLHCALTIKGQSNPVQLTFEAPQERVGGFRLPPKEWKAGIELGVMKSDSAGKLKTWSLALVEAMRNKEARKVKAMVEGFAEMSDVDVFPALEPGVEIKFAATSADQLEVLQGRSMALVSASPDPQTGAPRALIEAKADKVEWTMKQMLMLRGEDGRFYLDTPLGWKQILNLQP